MANDVATQHTAEEWRKWIAEILEGIEDTRFLYKIYSIAAIQLQRNHERGPE